MKPIVALAGQLGLNDELPVAAGYTGLTGDAFIAIFTAGILNRQQLIFNPYH
ncbi:MAG: hypothetical protein NTV01_22935 [Bacteroidia bacterium]|nr:hypothetical protein [Bacteroidia bacterium]